MFFPYPPSSGYASRTPQNIMKHLKHCETSRNIRYLIRRYWHSTQRHHARRSDITLGAATSRSAQRHHARCSDIALGAVTSRSVQWHRARRGDIGARHGDIISDAKKTFFLLHAFFFFFFLVYIFIGKIYYKVYLIMWNACSTIYNQSMWVKCE